jgi:hypothetical protein
LCLPLAVRAPQVSSRRRRIWTFRHGWPGERERLRQELIAGTYRFGLLSRVQLASGEAIDLWCARDALVLKCLALTLAAALPRSPRCFHLKAVGGDKKGAKAALRAVMDHLGPSHFVLKTDVKSYYASIDHARLIDERPRRLRARFTHYLAAVPVPHAMCRTRRAVLRSYARHPTGLRTQSAHRRVLFASAGCRDGTRWLVLRALHGRHPGVGADTPQAAAGRARGEPDPDRVGS